MVMVMASLQQDYHYVTVQLPSSADIFDNDCRKAKHSLRSMEKAARRTGRLSDTNSPAAVAWLTQRRQL